MHLCEALGGPGEAQPLVQVGCSRPLPPTRPHSLQAPLPSGGHSSCGGDQDHRSSFRDGSQDHPSSAGSRGHISGASDPGRGLWREKSSIAQP